MRRVRFHGADMGQIGHSRWFEDSEDWPKLDWKNVTAIETSEEMTVDDFKAKYPLATLPE